jgi:glutamate racemase
LIGTRHTVNSNVYQHRLAALGGNIELRCHATNLLASAIEEFGDHGVTESVLQAYLAHANLQDIDALILACTHYPIVKHRIAALLHKRVTLIDPSDIVAMTVQQTLAQQDLLQASADNATGAKQFYISDYTDSFAAGTRLFFKETIHVQHYPLPEMTVTA